MRIVFNTLALVALVGVTSSARATTLQRLSTGEMIQESTAIVHVKVLGSRSALRNQDIYTYYQLQVIEEWKSTGAQQFEVAVPGGAADGIRQTVAGAPSLSPGGEYVMFLWTSRSGLTQVIGLSQGLFSVVEDAAGNTVLIRPAVSGLMLDKSGRVVSGQVVSMTLSSLRSQIQQVLGTGK